MLNFLHILLALIPTRPNEEKVSLPEVRKQALMVRRTRRRSGTAMLVRVDPLPVPRITRRDYYNAFRGASAGCHLAIEGDQDLQVFAGCAKRVPAYYIDGRDSGSCWFTRERNSFARRDIDGQRVARTGRGPKRAARWVDLETYFGSTTIIGSWKRSKGLWR